MKNIVILLSTFLLIVILAACGGSTPASTVDVEPAAPTQAESTPTEVPATAEATASVNEEPAATESVALSAVSYASNVYPILEAKCVKCHGVESKKEGLDMLTYDNLMKGSRNGAVVTPGDANNSLLVQLILEGEMPNRGTKVTPEELQLIIEWINQGALNN